MRKLVFITLTLAPYKVKWMEALSNDFDVSIYYTRDIDIERHPEWLVRSSQVIHLIKGKDVLSNKGISLNLFKFLWKNRSEIIIFDGYGFMTQFFGLSMCRLLNIKHYVNVDGGIRVDNEAFLAVLIKRIMISNQSYYLASSDYTRTYLMDYGVEKEHIFIHPFTSLLKKDILERLVDEKSKRTLKIELNMVDGFQLLCVSQTIHRKGIDVLLEAMSKLDNVKLTIVGGQCIDEYSKIIEKHQLKNIRFIEYLDYEQLKKVYQAADLFVLPTRYDVWGLVINEAMANGLPVVTTNKCGAGLALIDPNYLVEPNDYENLAIVIEKIQEDPLLRKKLAMQSLERIQSYSIENVAALHRKLFSES